MGWRLSYPWLWYSAAFTIWVSTLPLTTPGHDRSWSGSLALLLLLLLQLDVFSLLPCTPANCQGCHGWFWDLDWGWWSDGLRDSLLNSLSIRSCPRSGSLRDGGDQRWLCRRWRRRGLGRGRGWPGLYDWRRRWCNRRALCRRSLERGGSCGSGGQEALLPMLFRTPEAAEVPWSIRRPNRVLISPPDLACAAAAPSALARSTLVRCSSGLGSG